MTTAVITGSTRGIGRGIAEQLLARGANVVVTGRRQEAVDAAAAELGAASDPARVLGVACDVRERDQLEALWDAAVARFGRVDVWVNNAGISAPRRPLWELDAATVEAVVATNLTGSLHGTAVAAAGMREQGSGTVYNMQGFGSGGQVADGMLSYGATKRAIDYLAKAVRKDLGDAPVRVGTISPGIVMTDLLVADYEDQPEKFEEAKRIFNILGDHVEAPTTYIAEKLLSAPQPPLKIAWLTPLKAASRFATARFRKRDLFATA